MPFACVCTLGNFLCPLPYRDTTCWLLNLHPWQNRFSVWFLSAFSDMSPADGAASARLATRGAGSATSLQGAWLGKLSQVVTTKTWVGLVSTFGRSAVGGQNTGTHLHGGRQISHFPRKVEIDKSIFYYCLLYTSPSPRDS